MRGKQKIVKYQVKLFGCGDEHNTCENQINVKKILVFMKEY